jgi:ParB-like chromosome segregation protein Spo0J
VQQAEAAPDQLGSFAVEWWPLDRVKPYNRNPRTIPEAAIEKVGLSIKEFGWRQPMVVDSKGVLVIGHVRRLGALHVGLTHGPVHVATDLSAAKIKALRIADNRTHEETGWDDTLLLNELLELRDDSDLMDALGFDEDEIERIMAAGDPADLPELRDGDREPFQNMTFTLHDTQVNIVSEAIREAKDQGDFDEALNANSNGNALARICESYLNRGKGRRGRSKAH